jgi:hypothetical protein
MMDNLDTWKKLILTLRTISILIGLNCRDPRLKFNITVDPSRLPEISISIQDSGSVNRIKIILYMRSNVE